MLHRSQVRLGAMLAAAALVVGCPTGANPNGDSDAMPDFTLTDANPNSARFNESVSPRDYLGDVSAWYFGHST
ncbi:MAG: hypothetical protein HZB38_17700 [Planctomycetes bacterium]|nr:hypothetical protein [Planctomycetota bacterium]